MTDKSGENNRMRNLSVLAANRQTESIVLRLREAVKNAGKQKDVASRAGIPASSLTDYLGGRELKLSVAARLANACGVSLEWLAVGENPVPQLQKEQSEIPVDFNNVSIPHYVGNASAGNGSFAANVDSYAVINIGRDALPPIVLSRLSSLVAVTVRGDSMSPSLYDCDTIFVDTNDCEIITGAVYVLRRDTDLLVKRLSWSVTGDLIVSSDNPLYKPEQISAAKARQLFEDGGFPIAIVGRVIWRMGIMGAR